MGSDWKQLTIGDVCYVTDGAHSKVERIDRGVMYLTSKNIGNGDLKLDTFDYISKESHAKLFTDTKRSQRRLKVGDVLMGIIGTFGNCYVYRDNDHFGISSSVAILRANKKSVLPEYLYYVISSNKFKSIVDKYKGGSVQGYTNIATLKALPISIPPIEIQRNIVNLLLPNDQKIALNRQTNQTLEQISQTLFKSWFVDFDPVFDNALINAISSTPQIDALDKEKLLSLFPEELHLKAKLRLTVIQNKLEQGVPIQDQVNNSFPNEFEHNEKLGWIPKGWEVLALSEVLEVKYGKDHKKLNDGDFPVYGSGGLMRCAEEYLYSGESVLIPRKGTLSNIMYVDRKFWTVDTMFYTIPKISNIAKFAFYHLKRLDFTSMNVGSAVPSMTTKVLNYLLILKPSDSLLEKFDDILSVTFNKINLNKNETEQLEKLRDTLLPKLISGKLKIPEVKNIAKGVM